jgi:SOS response regulatory protein OraA/RecX
VTPIVTRLRSVGAARVAVDLDGAPWRTLPAEVVLEAGLNVGTPLDRERARRVGVALRRARAMSITLQALGRRDHSRQSLVDRLSRARVPAAAAAGAVETLQRVGLVDDRRAARARATALADRDAGDLMIKDDLERRGFPADVVADVVAELEPEFERASRIVARAGSDPRTLRRLARKGFCDDVLQLFIAETEPNELG